MRLLDPRFRYIPAANTDVSATWRRFGFRPTTDSERKSRQHGDPSGPPDTASRSRARNGDVELAPWPGATSGGALKFVR